MVEVAGSLPPSKTSAFDLMAEIEVDVRPNRPFLKDMALLIRLDTGAEAVTTGKTPVLL